MAIQDLKRALVTPPITPGEDFEATFRRFYGQLALEVLNVHNSIQELSVAVPGLAASVTVSLQAPFPDANYCPIAIPVGWNTTVFINAPGDITSSTVKFTFGTAAPGGGGTLKVLVVR